MASAKNPNEYQKLARYFRHRELVYRAKAQREIDAYVNCAPNYPMAAKFLTRADVTARLYDHYLFKAEENAKLAGRYDGMLLRLGIKPASEISHYRIRQEPTKGLRRDGNLGVYG